MPDTPELRITPVTPELAPAVRALRVGADQYAFVGDIAFNLVDAERNPDSDAMAIVLGDTVIGFYRLDYAPTVVAWKPICGASVGLRALTIGRQWQGRGLGTRAIAAACEDLQRRHPERKLLALNVDCSNVTAIGAYRNAGFVDTGELYFGGRAGPQRLLVRRLGGEV